MPQTVPRTTGRAPTRLALPVALLALALLALLALLTGCSAGTDESATGGGDSAGQEAGADGDGGADGGETVAGEGAGSLDVAALTGRQVVVTGTVQVEVTDVGAATRAAVRAAERAGGYVAEEQSGTHDGAAGEAAWSQLVLRVPQDRFGAVRDEVAALGEVTTVSRSAQDVTDEVVDVEARVASQRASVERLRALLGRAGDLADVVAVEGELARRTAELEALLARRAALADRTALATLDVTLAAAGEAGDGSGFLAGVGTGWSALVATLAAAATVAGVLVPWLLPAALVAVLGLAVRRRRSRRAPSSAADPADPAAPAEGEQPPVSAR